ncbi:MAG: high frequency lysogenization protein HflD [Pseudohongiellaceae bacterium]
MTDTKPDFNRWEYQNIALAAVAQSAALVHRIATRGEAPQADLRACINPLPELDPPEVGDVYPNVADLGLGLRTVQSIFSSERDTENSEIVRYTLGMLLLRNRLTADDDMQRRIRERLALIEPLPAEVVTSADINADFEQSQQERVFRQLAGLYQDTISTLSYRIQVQGKVEHLKDEAVANRIRALLLAGIRSAVLWYQLGGRRWRLLLYRKRIHESAGNIRRKILSSV